LLAAWNRKVVRGKGQGLVGKKERGFGRHFSGCRKKVNGGEKKGR